MRYWEGFAAGIAATAVAIQLAAAAVLEPGLRRSYEELAGPIPGATRLAMNAAWMWGAPIAIIVALVLLHRLASDRARLGLTVAVTVLALAATAFSFWASYLPIFELSGRIEAE